MDFPLPLQLQGDEIPFKQQPVLRQQSRFCCTLPCHQTWRAARKSSPKMDMKKGKSTIRTGGNFRQTVFDQGKAFTSQLEDLGYELKV
jgi:hypothetical protein